MPANTRPSTNPPRSARTMVPPIPGALLVTALLGGTGCIVTSGGAPIGAEAGLGDDCRDGCGTTSAEDDGDDPGSPGEADSTGSDPGPPGDDDDGNDDDGNDDDGNDTGDDPGDPPPMVSTMCGDFECQPEEDESTCPFDCVPYTISPMGESTGKRCERSFTGLVPITEIGSGMYLGQAQGGLYPGGSNDRPAAHTDAGIAAAAAVAPIDGQVCLTSIGMSNTYQKWAMFMTEGVASVPDLHPSLRVVNGAVGSHPVNTTADPNGSVWGSIDAQIASGGCSPAQVQVAWVLHAERGPSGDFMTAADVFYDDLRATLINLDDHFPNLRLVYLSSRSYAGYGDRDNNPEPYAHQGAFVVKRLVEAQIEGSDPALSLESGFPWISWGPYLWSDGLGADRAAGGTPGRTIPDDGLEYACEDFADDGIHPGLGMRAKVSEQLVQLFTSDPTATPWFLQ